MKSHKTNQDVFRHLTFCIPMKYNFIAVLLFTILFPTLAFAQLESQSPCDNDCLIDNFNKELALIRKAIKTNPSVGNGCSYGHKIFPLLREYAITYNDNQDATLPAETLNWAIQYYLVYDSTCRREPTVINFLLSNSNNGPNNIIIAINTIQHIYNHLENDNPYRTELGESLSALNQLNFYLYENTFTENERKNYEAIKNISSDKLSTEDIALKERINSWKSQRFGESK